jgi:hypothetical protein
MAFPEPPVLSLVLNNTLTTEICADTVNCITGFQKQIFINGSYNKSVIIRPHDDSYIPFDNDFIETQSRLLDSSHDSTSNENNKIIVIAPNDVERFINILNESIRDSYNVIIDGRLDKLISIATIMFRDDVLVFDPFSLKIINIFNYTSNICKIPVAEMTLFRIIMLHIVKIILLMFRNTCVPFDVNMVYNIIKDAELKQYTNPELWILYNYFRAKHGSFRNDKESVSCVQPINHIMDLFMNGIFSLNASMLSLDVFSIDGVSYNDFLTSISNMIKMNIRSMY